MRGSFNSGRMLGKVSISVQGKRYIYIVNPSNSKGSAFLEYLGLLRGPRRKRVCVGKRSVVSPGLGISGCHRGLKVIFRRFGLFPGVAMGRGVALTPIHLGG